MKFPPARETGCCVFEPGEWHCPIKHVALAERREFGLLLAVDLDGADSGEIFLNQFIQTGQIFLLTSLLAHHLPAEQSNRAEHQRVQANGCERQPWVDRQHRWQGQAVGQKCVGEAEDREASSPPDVFHITGRPRITSPLPVVCTQAGS